MSAQAREALIANSFIHFDDTDDINDLKDEVKTSTYLIAALSVICMERINFIITAVRSDHHDDGPHGHAGGFAADFAVEDYTNDIYFIRALVLNPWVRGFGLGGRYQAYQNEFGKLRPDQIFFLDNNTDHLHIQVYGDDQISLPIT